VGVLLDILLILFLLIVPIAAVSTQVIPLRIASVTFHETDLAHAWLLIGQYAHGTFEQRFGYPTGYFFADEKRSQQPTRLLIREAQPAGAITDGCSLQISEMSMAGFGEGCGPGCMMFFAVAFLGAPFLLVSFFDRIYRLILRSRVDVRLQATGSDAIASFAFYGPGGYSLRRRYAQVFEQPVLPAALAPPVTVPAQRPAQEAEPDEPRTPGRHRG
jgi:hypothetical protein